MSESVTVPEKAKQTESTPSEWAWVDRAIWTERMLAALGNGVKGSKWFSLIRAYPVNTPLPETYAFQAGSDVPLVPDGRGWPLRRYFAMNSAVSGAFHLVGVLTG